jgi:hypothetical protein
MPETFVKVYIGTNEDFVDRLYVDLMVNGKCFTLWGSDNALHELGGDEFLSALEEAINIAVLLKIYLKLKLEIDPGILCMSDDFDVISAMRIRKFLKEAL